MSGITIRRRRSVMRCEGGESETAYERGWAELLNGQIISEAESAGFDVLITTDQGIRYQRSRAANRRGVAPPRDRRVA